MTAPAPALLRGYGLNVRLPQRWEGRVYQRPAPSGAAAAVGEQVHPVLHLANFALPPDRGDYGTGAVETMGAGDIFIALLEFGSDCLGTALFAPVGRPHPRPEQFDPNALQRRVAGQAGFQAFFTETNRPLGLYVVLGSYRAARTLCAEANRLLDGVEVERR